MVDKKKARQNLLFSIECLRLSTDDYLSVFIISIYFIDKFVFIFTFIIIINIIFHHLLFSIDKFNAFKYYRFFSITLIINY